MNSVPHFSDQNQLKARDEQWLASYSGYGSPECTHYQKTWEVESEKNYVLQIVLMMNLIDKVIQSSFKLTQLTFIYLHKGLTICVSECSPYLTLEFLVRTETRYNSGMAIDLTN